VVTRRAARAVSAHDLADFADLVRVALGSGFTVLRALALVCAHETTSVSAAFAGALAPGDDASPVDALAALPDRLGDASRELCVSLVASARYGAPALPALERVAFELRLARRLDAEARAKRTSILLLLPLVLCVLPAFVLLAIVPLVLGALAALPGATP
jgi:pilus assembly protein TadC